MWAIMQKYNLWPTLCERIGIRDLVISSKSLMKGASPIPGHCDCTYKYLCYGTGGDTTGCLALRATQWWWYYSPGLVYLVSRAIKWFGMTYVEQNNYFLIDYISWSSPLGTTRNTCRHLIRIAKINVFLPISCCIWTLHFVPGICWIPQRLKTDPFQWLR